MKPFLYFFLLTVALAAGCDRDQRTATLPNESTARIVTIRTMLFSPATIEVKSGKTIPKL